MLELYWSDELKTRLSVTRWPHNNQSKWVRFFVLFAQAGLSPQPIRDWVLHHIRHVLCGGAVGHCRSVSGCQSGSSGRKPYGQCDFDTTLYVKTQKLKTVFHTVDLCYSFTLVKMQVCDWLSMSCWFHTFNTTQFFCINIFWKIFCCGNVLYLFSICWSQSCPELSQHLRWIETAYYNILSSIVHIVQGF